MPSIPQSLLWISLVVLWLFVLVPMLISKRDAVRRTSDVALATRVLNTATAPGCSSAADRPPGTAVIRTGGRPKTTSTTKSTPTPMTRPTTHRNGRWWWRQPSSTPSPTISTSTSSTRTRAHCRSENRTLSRSTRPRKTVEEADELTLDLEEPEENVDTARYEIETDEYEDRPAGTADGYEYVDDSSGLEAPEESDLRMADSLMAARRRRYDSTKAAAVSARKYKFRKRMLALMALVLVASATAAFLVAPVAWWVCGGAGAVTLLYLGYLRRQTRIEERVRRRRMQRIARSRLGVENTDDREFDVVPSRLRRPGRGGAGDRRRGPDLRAPRLRTVGPAITTCRGRPASKSPRRRPVSAVARRLVACATDQGLWRSW